MAVWHAELAWVGGAVCESVLIEVEDDRISRLTPGAEPPADAALLHGLVLPGLSNVHSHAFQRALRGRAEGEPGTFWSWRDLMYRLAAVLDPDMLYELARATYAEMVLAGVTAVGEFHYLHHQAGGRPYANPNAMGEALVAAASEAGLRLTLLDTCYLRGGLDGSPLEGAQLRFGDGSAAAWAERVSRLADTHLARVGAAIHSVRAVDAASMQTVADWAAERAVPVHVHLSEQPAENEACLQATGLTPTALLERQGVLHDGTAAVHATHLTPADIGLLGSARAAVCLCPTTERDLADGVGPAAQLAAAGCSLCLGSDSQAVIDLFEEARAVELDQRLASRRRGHHPPHSLLTAATEAGAAALGWEAGRLEPGRRADLIALDLRSVRLAGFSREQAAAHVVYSAAGADVTDVVVGGREVVRGGRHLGLGDVGGLLDAAVARAWALVTD